MIIRQAVVWGGRNAGGAVLPGKATMEKSLGASVVSAKVKVQLRRTQLTKNHEEHEAPCGLHEEGWITFTVNHGRSPSENVEG